jgi:hypothetical protein
MVGVLIVDEASRLQGSRRVQLAVQERIRSV